MYCSYLFNKIKTETYKETGNSVNYRVEVDTDTQRVRLMFEESNGKVDWKNNFNFPIKPYKQRRNILWYHGGYCKAWKSSNDVIMEELIKAAEQHPSYPVEISGWSLGGAMAVMAAEDYNFRTGDRAILITYGAPKVCWGFKTTQRVRESCLMIFQYAHTCDCVTYMPPFPLYEQVRLVKVGHCRFSFKKFFNPSVYHCIYGNDSVY